MSEEDDNRRHRRMLRPEARVLPDASLIPPGNLVRPAPNHFTHELTADEPYRFDRPASAGGRPAGPDGVLRSGERVLLAVRGDDGCRVITPAGLYVTVRCAGLRAL